MVVPWIGYSLSELIKRVEPTGNAKFVEFVTLADPKTMPNVGSQRARMALCRRPAARRGHASADAADLRPVRRNPAEPERRTVAADRAMEIRLQERQVAGQDPLHRDGSRRPAGTRRRRRNTASIRTSIRNVDHPRWSQATERRIGEDGLFKKKRPTLMFNGYETQVGQLYAGMDLTEKFLTGRRMKMPRSRAAVARRMRAARPAHARRPGCSHPDAPSRCCSSSVCCRSAGCSMPPGPTRWAPIRPRR